MNIKSSALKVGTTVSFHPVVGAHHVAEGVIISTRSSCGVFFAEVKATEGDGAGKVWTICPEDVIFIRPLASWFNGKL